MCDVVGKSWSHYSAVPGSNAFIKFIGAKNYEVLIMDKKSNIIEEFELSANTINNLSFQLSQEESKSGTKYRACRLKINEQVYFIGFDKIYYMLRKILKRG